MLLLGFVGSPYLIACTVAPLACVDSYTLINYYLISCLIILVQKGRSVIYLSTRDIPSTAGFNM
jgi:hypothetical protein